MCRTNAIYKTSCCSINGCVSEMIWAPFCPSASALQLVFSPFNPASEQLQWYCESQSGSVELQGHLKSLNWLLQMIVSFCHEGFVNLSLSHLIPCYVRHETFLCMAHLAIVLRLTFTHLVISEENSVLSMFVYISWSSFVIVSFLCWW